MFDWLRRIIRRFRGDAHPQPDGLVWNGHPFEGEPLPATRPIGSLELRSRTIAMGDPMQIDLEGPHFNPNVEIPNVAVDAVQISSIQRVFPSGVRLGTGIRIELGTPAGDGEVREIGMVGTDSARLVIADKADLLEHWARPGQDRIGVISLVQGDAALKLLTKRFRLKTRRVDPVHAEVVGPVSELLEEEIKQFLESHPKFSDFPSMHFSVRTNNSFERAIHWKGGDEFMPIGESPSPLMFVCRTGWGDGCFSVMGTFEGDALRSLEVVFIKDGEWKLED